MSRASLACYRSLLSIISVKMNHLFVNGSTFPFIYFLLPQSTTTRVNRRRYCFHCSRFGSREQDLNSAFCAAFRGRRVAHDSQKTARKRIQPSGHHTAQQRIISQFLTDIKDDTTIPLFCLLFLTFDSFQARSFSLVPCCSLEKSFLTLFALFPPSCWQWFGSNCLSTRHLVVGLLAQGFFAFAFTPFIFQACFCIMICAAATTTTAPNTMNWFT